MTTWTPETETKLRKYLASHDLPKGLGSEESACSIAAINLALTGELTDNIPACMSEVIGRATIVLQDAMPAEMRNSDRYKAWLPTAAGTGRDREEERLAVITDWMWSTVLPELQGLADKKGFGEEWQWMCEERSEKAARAAYVAARAATNAAARAAYAAPDAAYAATYVAATAAYVAARGATRAARAARAAYAAYAAPDAAATHVAAYADFWSRVDLIGMLEKMTNLGEPQ